MKKPQWVGSGSFRVDRAKALEKLRDFQTPEPGLFMLPWIRAAVANGARGIELDLAKDGSFTLAFDGPSLDPRLADPAACLFGPAPEPRLRHLALGILAALRLDPKLVSLTSGVGAERRCLRLGPAGDSLDAPESESGENILWVMFRDGLPAEDWHLKAIDACRACPAHLRIGGTRLAAFDGAEAEGLMIREEDRRIWLEPLDRADSAIDVCQFGVRGMMWTPHAPGRAAVGGFVDDPAIALDASQTGVVRDKAWSAMRLALARATDRLVIRVAGTQSRRLGALAGWLRDKAWRRAWAWSLQNGSYGPWPETTGAKRQAFENAVRVALWLRRMRKRSRLSDAASHALREASKLP